MNEYKPLYRACIACYTKRQRSIRFTIDYLPVTTTSSFHILRMSFQQLIEFLIEGSTDPCVVIAFFC